MGVWPGLGLAMLGGWGLWGVVLGGGYVGRHKNAGSWGVEGCGERDPVKLRQRRVLCVCYACQAVCTREGGQP